VIGLCACVSLSLCVCLSVVMFVSPAKMAETLDMLFGMVTQVGPVKHVSDGDPNPPMRWSNFGGKMAAYNRPL